MNEQRQSKAKPKTAGELEPLFAEAVRSWSEGSRLDAVEAMTPDASLRRYFRLKLSGAPAKTAVAMVFDSLASPEHSGARHVPTDEACVELTGFFGSHGVTVPALLVDARTQGFLLIEDCGDRQLIDTVLGTKDTERRPEADVERYYRKAINQILTIQQIPKIDSFFIFERSFSVGAYYHEMLELRDYVLAPKGTAATAIAAAENGFRLLADELNAFPKALVHRDFHSWNILIDQDDRIRVIDFQDALMATRCYDLVALLNDRDTDQALGEALYLRLLQYFNEQKGSPDWFREEYLRVLLSRDLKVAGRFSKLSSERGLKHYERWIPGTVRRIGRTLACLSGTNPQFRELAEVLSSELPLVAEGAQTPFRFE